MTVAFTGALNGSSAQEIRSHLQNLTVADGPEEIRINLAGVTAINVQGAEPLLVAQLCQHRRGATLRLTHLSSAVLHFLHSEPRFARLLIPPENISPAAVPSRPKLTSISHEDLGPTAWRGARG